MIGFNQPFFEYFWGVLCDQTLKTNLLHMHPHSGQDFARSPSGTVKDRSFLARFFTTSRACAYGSRINN